MIEWLIWAFTIIFSGIGIGYYIRKYRKPDLLIGLYVIFLAAAQIIAAKIINIGPLIAPASIFIYPFTLLLLDMIVEFFGIKLSYRAIAICFITQIVLVSLLWLSIIAPPVSYWTLQPGWEQIFNLSIRITGASWIAFLITHTIDAKLYFRLKKLAEAKWKNSKYPAIRTAVVDIPILALDSVIFIFLAFYGIFDIIPLITGQMLAKWITGIADSPIISLAKRIAYGK